MSGPAPLEKQPDVVEYDVKPGSHPVGPQNPDHAWAAIEKILKGEGAADTLGGLARQLADDKRDELAGKLASVAHVATGDITIDVGQAVGAERKAILVAAFSAKSGPTLPRLTRLVAELDSFDVDALDSATMGKIVTTFKGQPLLSVMPRSTWMVTYFVGHEDLVRWLIESTPPAVVADLMGVGGSNTLAALLDKLKLWKPWIDEVHVALPNYSAMADGTKDPKIKARLLAPFGSRATVEEGGVHIADPEPDGVATLDEAISTGASAHRLIQAITEAGTIPAEKTPEIIAAIRRVKATADDALAASYFVTTAGADWLVLLLDSPGVTSAHVMAFLSREQSVKVSALSDAAIRALRAKAGKALHFYHLISTRTDSDHRRIVDVEVLREWFLEDARPGDLLWFCGAQGELATKATRIVAARDPDWKWVRELTGAEDAAQLRALALACGHAPTIKFIREELLHESKGVAHFDHGEISPKSYGGEQDRLRFAVALHDPDAVMQRLADLDDAERAAFGKNPAAVADLVQNAKLDEFQFARAADLLDLDFRQSVALCPGGQQIVNHLRTRPAKEEAAALADSNVVARAAKDIVADLFVVFPSLANRPVLAKALSDNSELLRLLLVGSDPRRVVEMLAVEPVATAALEIFAEDESLVRLLPAREHMSAAGRGLVDRLAATPGLEADVADTAERVRTDKSVEDRIGGADADEKVAVTRAATMHDLDQTESLTVAIDKLAAGDLVRDRAAILAVLASHQSQVPAFLDDVSQWERVSDISIRLELSPAVACPFIAPELLIQMTNALRWYFELFDRTALLHLVTNASVAGHVAQNLGGDSPSARSWLDGLPQGAALVDRERRALDLIEAATTNGDVLRSLFLVRFGVPAPEATVPDGKEHKADEPEKDKTKPSTFGAGDVDSLYRIVSRLPASHLNQQRIREIASEKLNVPGADGVWTPGRRVVIGEDEHEGKSDSLFHSDELDQQLDDDPAEGERAPTADNEWMTADQVKRAFGFDDAGIKARVDSKEILVQTIVGTTYYKIKPAPIDSFTQVVLHEIGHSIDDILGNHTKPVYEFAGWHEFNDDQFDAWAGEMGGWEKVSGPDKPKIKQAWIDAARTQRGVHDLVSADHPAMAERYADVGIVKAGREGRSFSCWYRTIIGNRMFVAGSYIGRWYSVDAAIVPSAPSYYSLFAPQEYFAESYVEYYRGVDGTPGSAKNKGGLLAAPVKKFFDEKVDALKYDPRRFEKHDDDP